jgi:hypothetical protein
LPDSVSVPGCCLETISSACAHVKQNALAMRLHASTRPACNAVNHESAARSISMHATRCVCTCRAYDRFRSRLSTLSSHAPSHRSHATQSRTTSHQVPAADTVRSLPWLYLVINFRRAQHRQSVRPVFARRTVTRNAIHQQSTFKAIEVTQVSSANTCVACNANRTLPALPSLSKPSGMRSLLFISRSMHATRPSS